MKSSLIGNILQDIRILLELALEATVKWLWPVVELVVGGLIQLLKMPVRCFKMFL